VFIALAVSSHAWALEPGAIEAKLRLGGGIDGNALKQSPRTESGVLHVSGLVEARPVEDLHVRVYGAYDQHLITDGVNPAFALAHLAYGLRPHKDVLVQIGTTASAVRERVMFARLGLPRTGTVDRFVLADSIAASANWSVGLFDLSLVTRGDVKLVNADPKYTLFGGEGALRAKVSPVRGLVLAARYGFSARHLDGVPVAGSTLMTVHDFWFSALGQPWPFFEVALDYRHEIIEPGAYAGARDSVRVSAVLDWERTVVVDVAAELSRRVFPDFEDTYMLASVSAEYWWSEWFGVFVSYIVEREETDPGTIFVRHVVSVGPAGRFLYSGR